MQVYTINGQKAEKLWGGICFGYNVTQKEIDEVVDENHGDTLLYVCKYDGIIEIIKSCKIDMCIVEGGLSGRNTSHCMGDFCSFCGKFD